MKLLIIGCKGQLGTDMMLTAQNAGHKAEGVDFPDIDITDSDFTKTIIYKQNPDVLINCAAFTAVDDCEVKDHIAFKVNAEGPANIAHACKQIGAKLVHISTDYVFDGTAKSPYIESDTPNPQTIYGKSKLAGEQNIASIMSDYYTLRIAWLYGLHGANFVKTIKNAALKKQGTGEGLKVVNDQFGTPTWTIDVCDQLMALIETSHFGLYHCTSEGMCSWYDFACEIVKGYGINTPVAPCSTSDYPRPAPRPTFSVLDNAHLKSIGLNKMYDWKEAFRKFVYTEKGKD